MAVVHPLFGRMRPQFRGMAKFVSTNTAAPWWGVTLVSCAMQTTIPADVGTSSTFTLALRSLTTGSEALPHFVVRSINPSVGFVYGSTHFLRTAV